jgi:hypothetical protein
MYIHVHLRALCLHEGQEQRQKKMLMAVATPGDPTSLYNVYPTVLVIVVLGTP